MRLILRPGKDMIFANTFRAVERIYYVPWCPENKILPLMGGGWQVRDEETLLRLFKEAKVEFHLEKAY